MRLSQRQDFPASAEAGGAARVPLTIAIPVLNEADRLPEALRALSWADEVIVVDGGSTDSSVQIARDAGATVLEVHGPTIAAQRNAGIAAARNPWVFALDVDERIPDALRSEIAAVLHAPKHTAYRVRFRNFYLGAELRHGLWGRDWHVRLFRRDLRFVEQQVHEKLEHVSEVGSLVACVEHTPYRDLHHHLTKMLQYARWGAQDLYAQGRRARVWDVTLVPAWRFVREYFIFSGWRDGQRGLVAAALGACAGLLKFAHLFALQWNADSRASEHPPKSPQGRQHS